MAILAERFIGGAYALNNSFFETLKKFCREVREFLSWGYFLIAWPMIGAVCAVNVSVGNYGAATWCFCVLLFLFALKIVRCIEDLLHELKMAQQRHRLHNLQWQLEMIDLLHELRKKNNNKEQVQ